MSNFCYRVPKRNKPSTAALTSSPHVEEEALPCKDKSFFRIRLFSSVSLVFFSVSLLYSSSSLCVLASCSSASWLFFLSSSSSPWTAAAASAASCSRSSLSFDEDDLEDAGFLCQHSSGNGVSCSGGAPWTRPPHWMLAPRLQQQVQTSELPFGAEIS